AGQTDVRATALPHHPRQVAQRSGGVQQVQNAGVLAEQLGQLTTPLDSSFSAGIRPEVGDLVYSAHRTTSRTAPQTGRCNDGEQQPVVLPEDDVTQPVVEVTWSGRLDHYCLSTQLAH